MKSIFSVIILLACLSLSAKTYYVSNSGSDLNDGTTVATSWKTINKVNSNTFYSGDSILFKRGDSFKENLRVYIDGSWRDRMLVPQAGYERNYIHCLGDSQTDYGGGYTRFMFPGSLWTIENNGVGGNTTRDMLARIESDILEDRNGGWAVVLAGANDMYMDEWTADAQYTIARLDSIYKILSDAGMKVVAVTMTPHETYDTYKDRRARFNAINSYIMSGPENTVLSIDCNPTLADPNNSLALNPLYDDPDLPDHIHMNDAGQQALGELINNAVNWGSNPSPYITYGAYGSGEKPLLHQAVSLNNTSDWTDLGSNMWEASGSISYEDELISNTSIESNLDGWNPYVYSGTAIRSTADSHDGSASIRLDVTDSGSSSYETAVKTNIGDLTLEEGRTYHYDFWIKSSISFTTLKFGIYDQNGAGLISNWVTNTKTIGTDWTQITVAFTMTASSTDADVTVDMGGYAPSGSVVYFDDASLKEVVNDDRMILNHGLVLLNNTTPKTGRFELTDVDEQGEYFHDSSDSTIKMYSTSNPASYYTNIKACNETYIVHETTGLGYYVIRDLEIKYTSGYGTWSTNGHDIIIDNLTVEWIGGEWYGTEGYRQGNGIGFWRSCENVEIKNNLVGNCMDAGISPQNVGDPTRVQKNISIHHNVIYNCHYAIEWFNDNSSTENENIKIFNNTCVNSGNGLLYDQRPDSKTHGNDIMMWGYACDMSDISIYDNIFFNSRECAVYASQATDLPVINNNNYYNVSTLVKYQSGTYTELSALQAAGHESDGMNVDPLFTDATNGDYSLLSASPLIDAASNGSDIGALQHIRTINYFGDGEEFLCDPMSGIIFKF